jgi:hypothetical protein
MKPLARTLQRFRDKVKSFQKCLGSKNQAGYLTKNQLKSALEGDTKCMPTTPPVPLMPPPPPIEGLVDPRPPEDPNDPYVTTTLTKEEFSTLRVLFGLLPFEATGQNSPRFKDKVKSFQQCLDSKNQAGFLTKNQLKSALEGDPKCMPKSPATAPASQPAGSPAPQPAAPSAPNCNQAVFSSLRRHQSIGSA